MFNKMIINLKQNSQVTIPKEIVKKLKLKIGDSLSIVLENDEIKLKPVLVIDRSQSWYWSREWQEKIKEADIQLAEGKANYAADVNDLLKQLEE